MPPTRRYLRLTATSAIEVRIYLDNPSDTARWLLAPRAPALPRVLAAVRPLVLPKLREESERARGKGKGKGRKRGVKDTVRREDFDVSVFVTELSAQHGILRRRGEVVGGRVEGAVREEEEGEERENENVRMGDIPLAEAGAAGGASGEALFVSDAEEGDDGSQTMPVKRKRREGSPAGSEEAADDDKKKLGLRTAYDGFRIYGRILCLVVKRKGIVRGKQLVGGAGQAMMEEWIGATQMAQGQMWDE
ncbi:hypothetical protein MMC27_005317 [Xylographa pallens]|nr:hypothetical protein [Xylographa pallens]